VQYTFYELDSVGPKLGVSVVEEVCQAAARTIDRQNMKLFLKPTHDWGEHAGDATTSVEHQDRVTPAGFQDVHPERRIA
jgi:hypothetical protein